jgi:hypothetical protein
MGAAAAAASAAWERRKPLRVSFVLLKEFDINHLSLRSDRFLPLATDDVDLELHR